VAEEALGAGQAVLAFVRERGVVHPREVDAHFAHGKATNWFGGSSNASTQLLDGMHYRGLLRIARREGGVRLYAAREAVDMAAADARRAAAMDALVDVVVRKYAPLPERSLAELVMHLRGGVPQWTGERRAALLRAKARLPSAAVDGQRWYWPAGENPASGATRRPIACDCWRPSIPWCGTAAASSCCGAGPTASRPTRRPRSANAATTRCRCCGASRSSAGATWPGKAVRCRPTSALSPASRRAMRHGAAALDDELGRLETFLTPRA
jgi:hypothetical protein